MQLFLFLNDFAGRWPLLDALMRGVYIATIPLLAVITLGLLTLAPRGNRSPARSHVALATLLALGGAALLAWGIEVWAQSLGLGILSPRPFMTRWVNLLIIEPQDNSFPCVEVMVAAILSVAVGTANRRWGAVAALATLLLMVARLFCGSNYFADVGVGALLGVGLMGLSLALCDASRDRKARELNALAGVFTLGATALGTFLLMAAMPRFAGKLQLPWGIALPSNAALTARAPRAARATLQEGEGIPEMDASGDGAPGASTDAYAGEAEAQALDKRSTLFLPKTEAYLTQVLAPKALPFTLLDVEVAPINFKDGSYRAAALRFEVDPQIPNARHMVAQRAATLVKAAFAADPKLDNVDISGVVTGDAAQIDNSLMNFAGDEVPVFTASIQRRNLIVKAPQWANDPNLEGGLWLRSRSRLWINDQILPPTPEAPQPTATPKATAAPSVKATPTIAPPTTATPQLTPTATAKATVASKLTAMPKTTVPPKATPTSKPTPTPKPSVLPTTKPTARATVQLAPTKTPVRRPLVQSYEKSH